MSVGMFVIVKRKTLETPLNWEENREALLTISFTLSNYRPFNHSFRHSTPMTLKARGTRLPKLDVHGESEWRRSPSPRDLRGASYSRLQDHQRHEHGKRITPSLTLLLLLLLLLLSFLTLFLLLLLLLSSLTLFLLLILILLLLILFLLFILVHHPSPLSLSSCPLLLLFPARDGRDLGGAGLMPSTTTLIGHANAP
ncbi:hypothetical protein O3P69_012769 [Scylla paramamosain]|uniref:Uncharacterized protein n=1 Tax=Scylla paramamosain TaxID=85552 RepID=A0AAW0SM47_SCYPA